MGTINSFVTTLINYHERKKINDASPFKIGNEVKFIQNNFRTLTNRWIIEYITRDEWGLLYYLKNVNKIDIKEARVYQLKEYDEVDPTSKVNKN